MSGQWPVRAVASVPATSSSTYTVSHSYTGGGGFVSGGSYTVSGNPGGTGVGTQSGGAYRSQIGFLTELFPSFMLPRSGWFIPVAVQAPVSGVSSKLW